MGGGPQTNHLGAETRTILVPVFGTVVQCDTYGHDKLGGNVNGVKITIVIDRRLGLPASATGRLLTLCSHQYTAAPRLRFNPYRSAANHAKFGTVPDRSASPNVILREPRDRRISTAATRIFFSFMKI